MENSISLQNKKQIVSINVNPGRPEKYWAWKEERKVFGIVVRKAGYYHKFLTDIGSVNLPGNCRLKNGKLFTLPSVHVNFTNGESIQYEFESDAEAYEAAYDIIHSRGWLGERLLREKIGTDVVELKKRIDDEEIEQPVRTALEKRVAALEENQSNLELFGEKLSRFFSSSVRDLSSDDSL